MNRKDANGRRRSGQDVWRRMRTHPFLATAVLMTALAACIALLPLLINADEPGKEILHRSP